MKRRFAISPPTDAARRRLGYRGPPPPQGKSAYQRFREFVEYSSRSPERATITIIVDADGCHGGSFAPGRKDEPSRR